MAFKERFKDKTSIVGKNGENAGLIAQPEARPKKQAKVQSPDATTPEATPVPVPVASSAASGPPAKHPSKSPAKQPTKASMSANRASVPMGQPAAPAPGKAPVGMPPAPGKAPVGMPPAPGKAPVGMPPGPGGMNAPPPPVQQRQQGGVSPQKHPKGVTPQTSQPLGMMPGGGGPPLGGMPGAAPLGMPGKMPPGKMPGKKLPPMPGGTSPAMGSLGMGAPMPGAPPLGLGAPMGGMGKKAGGPGQFGGMMPQGPPAGGGMGLGLPPPQGGMMVPPGAGMDSSNTLGSMGKYNYGGTSTLGDLGGTSPTNGDRPTTKDKDEKKPPFGRRANSNPDPNKARPRPSTEPIKSPTYKTYSLEDYNKLKAEPTLKKGLGGIGPSDTDEQRFGRLMKKKAKEYSEASNRANMALLAAEGPRKAPLEIGVQPISKEVQAKNERRLKAVEFAKNVPKPKVKEQSEAMHPSDLQQPRGGTLPGRQSEMGPDPTSPADANAEMLGEMEEKHRRDQEMINAVKKQLKM